ncbi:MAG: response regulator [Chloroflexota bacterium]
MAKVIVIEDVPDSAKLAKKILIKSGYEAVIASDGEEAIQFISAEKYDLVLLDLGLPDVDGQTLLGMLRRNYGMEDTPIIVCTAWPPESAKRMSEAYGFDGYLSKPYRVADFLHIVEKFISQANE